MTVSRVAILVVVVALGAVAVVLERWRIARRLNDVKSEFLGAAAHDLKNPLGWSSG